MRQIDLLDQVKIEEGTFMPLHKNSNRQGIGVAFNRRDFTAYSSQSGQKMIIVGRSGCRLTTNCRNTDRLIFIRIGICQRVSIDGNGIGVVGISTKVFTSF